MDTMIAVTPDLLAACHAALKTYARSLCTSMRKAGVGSPEELWEEMIIVEPEWAEGRGYAPVPSLLCEIGDLALYGDRFEWRDQPFSVAVPEGFRAVAPTCYAVQLLPEALASSIERSPGGGGQLLRDQETRKIRQLNDLFRTTLFGGRVVVTQGVQRSAMADEIVRAVMNQDPRRRPADDPSGCHEIGAVVVGSVRYFWKIDYYNRDYTAMSPDPTDPSLTMRVLTILRADEY